MECYGQSYPFKVKETTKWEELKSMVFGVDGIFKEGFKVQPTDTVYSDLQTKFGFTETGRNLFLTLDKFKETQMRVDMYFGNEWTHYEFFTGKDYVSWDNESFKRLDNV